MHACRFRPVVLVCLIALVPTRLVGQIDTLDLSGQVPETVVLTEFDGEVCARIGAIVVDDRGVWVFDRGHMTVFHFGLDGDLRAAYRREGNGPGEFLFASDLRVDSVLTVTDLRLGRVFGFSLDGQHIETSHQERRPVTPDGMEVPLGAVTPLADGHLVGATIGRHAYGRGRDGDEAHSDPFHHVLLFPPDGSRLDTLASQHIGGGRWDAPGRLCGGVESGLGVSGVWTVVGDSVGVLVDGIAGTLARVRIRDGLPAIDTFDLGIRARPVSHRDLAEIEAKLREEKPDLSRRLDFDLAEGWSVATALLPGPRGEFWLRPAVRGDRQDWIVARPGQPRKWRVVLPERFDLQTIHGGRLYGVAKDELDVPRVAALPDPRPRS